MAKFFFATCSSCGHQRKVRRQELDRASKPRCKHCGATIELSDAAREALAGAAAAQRRRASVGTRDAGPAVEEHILPRRETKRYDFWEHPTLYDWVLRDRELGGSDPSVAANLRATGPLRFYREFSTARPGAQEDWASEILNRSEEALYASGRPYYKVWPSIAAALQHTEMRVDGEFFRVPYEAVEIRLPKGEDNPLAPICALVAARHDGAPWNDGRAWSLVLAYHTAVPQFYRDAGRKLDPDDVGAQCWLADVPIRNGLLLEDAIDQTALARNGASRDDVALARRLMRVATGTCFFGLDRHEVILPEVPRRVVEHYRRRGRQPTPAEAARELREAREAGLFGFLVGSEIDLPTAIVDEGSPPSAGGEHRELTAGHIRRGHMRMQPHGPGRRERRLQFVMPTVVRPDLPLRGQHGYRVRL